MKEKHFKNNPTKSLKIKPRMAGKRHHCNPDKTQQSIKLSGDFYSEKEEVN